MPFVFLFEASINLLLSLWALICSADENIDALSWRNILNACRPVEHQLGNEVLDFLHSEDTAC